MPSIPVSPYTVGQSVNWTGSDPDAAGSGTPYITNPGTVMATSPNLVIQWADGFSLSVFQPGDTASASVAAIPGHEPMRAAPKAMRSAGLAESNALDARMRECPHWSRCSTGCGGNHCNLGKFNGRPWVPNCHDCLSEQDTLLRDKLSREHSIPLALEYDPMSTVSPPPATTADLLALVNADNMAVTAAQKELLDLQSQITAVTGVIGSDTTQAAADTATFAKDLQTNGPAYVLNGDNTVTLYSWDGATGYHATTAQPITRALAAPAPPPATA